jgi:hypothetical protein
MNTKTLKMIRHNLAQKRYIVHNVTQTAYNVFLTPDDDDGDDVEKKKSRKTNDLSIRTIGGHVLSETELFLLQPNECLVLYARMPLTECTPLNHVCVSKQSSGWLESGKIMEKDTSYIVLGEEK